MRKSIMAAAALGTAACSPMATEPRIDAAGSARLAAALEGRVPDAPLSCVPLRNVRGNTPIDAGTILFDGPGSTVYVNRLRQSCPGLRDWHALRLRTVGASMCSGEVMVAFDPRTGMEFDGCVLGEFQPYRRVR